jgi:maltooligosyltrehalose synthase
MQDRIPSVLEAVAKDIAATRRFPESTYRLQFHAGFTFRDALHLVPYLQALGITHCYASPLHPSDRVSVERAVAQAERKSPTLSRALFGFVRDMLLLEYPASASEEDQGEQQRFVGKFQQVTSPVMAKGREDTAFYVYNR